MSSQAPQPAAQKPPFYRRWWFYVIVAVVILGGIARSGRDTARDTARDATPTASTVADTAAVTPASSSTPEAPATPTVDEAPASMVTLANFNRIRNGMTGDEVWKILGPGELMSESSFGEHTSAIYTWKVDNGIANMNVTFSNGRVSGKAQLGLE